MGLFLYGFSALDVMRYVRSTNGGRIPGRRSQPRRLGGAIHSHRKITELDTTAQFLLSHIRGPVHALVPHPNLLTDTGRIVTHLWTKDIPAGAYLNLGHDVYLPTPAFLMQQLALKLDMIDLINIGLELCGFYSRWGFPKGKIHPSPSDEFQECTFELEPATTAAKLKRFIGERKGERGRSATDRALHYVLDHSASPMESATYLLLCLPRRLGGRGLPFPVFNAKVNVSTSTSTTERYPDLYWPAHSLDIEYDSDEDHSGQWSRYRDSKRQVELVAEKITVLPLTRHQLTDPHEFDAFATSVRRCLGKRSRSLTPEWRANYLELRRRLLRGGMS